MVVRRVRNLQSDHGREGHDFSRAVTPAVNQVMVPQVRARPLGANLGRGAAATGKARLRSLRKNSGLLHGRKGHDFSRAMRTRYKSGFSRSGNAALRARFLRTLSQIRILPTLSS
jgi:hypothetical protein